MLFITKANDLGTYLIFYFMKSNNDMILENKRIFPNYKTGWPSFKNVKLLYGILSATYLTIFLLS